MALYDFDNRMLSHRMKQTKLIPASDIFRNKDILIKFFHIYFFQN